MQMLKMFLTVSDVPGCHTIGMGAFEGTKHQNVFQDQHLQLGVVSKCMNG